jgi:hypothetical protein
MKPNLKYIVTIKEKATISPKKNESGDKHHNLGMMQIIVCLFMGGHEI